ncbi:MAG: lysophospholipid acyltransferase family protein [Muribaculaceae bacterium]|nr:lysophospholipid acyltransferase family protein [Muribaculaceae bacterium]
MKNSWLSRVSYGGVRLIGALPLRMLYCISDFLAWLARDVVKYRRRVVDENIDSSFPQLPWSVRRSISRQFYNFLGDYFMETLHLSSMSEKEMRRRLQVEGIEEVNAAFAEGKSVILYLGHYCNWEWVSSLPLYLPKEVVAAQIYHPLENKVADEVFLKIRGHFGAVSVPMADTLRRLIGWRNEGKQTVTGFIADQAPTMDSIHHFVEFLNHDTPVLTGGEKIARKLKAAVFYCDLSRPRRGEYRCVMKKIADDASATDEFYITDTYYSLLEQSILHQPAYWLWSHRRWKRTREDFENEYGGKTAERLSHL